MVVGPILEEIMNFFQIRIAKYLRIFVAFVTLAFKDTDHLSFGYSIFFLMNELQKSYNFLSVSNALEIFVFSSLNTIITRLLAHRSIEIFLP